jgi:hypothetical protein
MAVPLGTAIASDSFAAPQVALLGGGKHFTFIDKVSGRNDLVAVDANNASRQLIAPGLPSGLLNVAAAGVPNLQLVASGSLVTADRTEVFGFGNTSSTMAVPTKPSWEAGVYTAMTGKVTSLGKNVTRDNPAMGGGPFNVVDPNTRSLTMRKDTDSLFGTSTYLTYPLGSGTAITIADKARAIAANPDKTRVAALTVTADGKTELRSGNAGAALMLMGNVSTTRLDSTNLFWSGDGSRLYVIEAVSNGDDPPVGKLWTGTTGASGLVAVAAKTMLAFPNMTGTKATIVINDASRVDSGTGGIATYSAQ